MKKILFLNYGRPFPTAEPDGETTKNLEVKSFRVVFGVIEIMDLNDKGYYFNPINGLFYYDGVYYSDIWVDVIATELPSEPFDVAKTNKINPLPIEHHKVSEVIRLLKEEINADGETMQHILEKCCMDEQMFKQLLNKNFSKYLGGMFRG